MKRSDFIKLTINNPQKGAEVLKAQARKLEKCKGVTETVNNLSDILFVTDRTVFRDCKK